jgi:Flp pilus assembly protein TadD
MDFLIKLFGNKQSDMVIAQEFFEKGVEYAKEQNWPLAIEALKEAVRLNPKHAKAQMTLCIAYGGVMEMNLARHHYNILQHLDINLANLLANTPAGMLILRGANIIQM